ncbi:MAG: hypothetical protein K6T54_02715 [Ignavibacterium sp.]|nr:hypothetical protein [Ignavibacterium sp.]
MKKIYLLSIILLSVFIAQMNAQTMKYEYSFGSSSFTPISGANGFSLIGTLDEGYSNPVPIGFTFNYLGVAYDSFQVSTNGFIRLGSGLTSATTTNTLAGTLRGIIAPLWDDLSIADSASLTYVVTGAAPNRVLTVEWRNVKWPFSASAANAEFQVKLYENDSKIEFQYGTFGTVATTVTASIGLSDFSTIGTAGRATGTFLSLNIAGVPTARTFYATMGLEFASVNQAPDNNTIITFTPPAAPLSGTYTVGGTSPDFATLSQAAIALNVRGISGPVSINIRPGTYEDVFHLINIPGASHLNRITVTKESGTVTISPRYGARTASTVLAGDAIIRLDGASFVTIDGLNLVDNPLNSTTALKYEFGVVLTNGEVAPIIISASRFNILKNLFIDLDAQSVPNTNAIGIRVGTTVASTFVDTSLTNSYNVFQDLTIERFWRAAIQLYGFAGLKPDVGNKITAVTGRNLFRNINATSGSGSDIRVIEANAQRDLIIEKTDIYDLVVNATGWSTNVLSAVRLNPANSSADFNDGNVVIRDINIYNLELQNAAVTSGSVVGVEVLRLGNNSNLTINNVSVSDLFTNGNSTALSRGIVINSGAGSGAQTTVNIYNNLVYDLRAPRSTGAPSIRAFDVQNTAGGLMNANLYYNTAYMDNAVPPTAAMHQSSVVYLANMTSSVLDMRNNIFVNTMAAGTRATVIYATSNANLLRLAPTNNYNLYYIDNPSATRVTAYNGATSFQTLTAYQNAVATGGLGGPRDLQSVSANPPFISAVAPYNLNLTAGSSTPIESGGRPITGITTDYAGNLRNANFPDLGAYEFSGVNVDVVPPTISYTPLVNTSSTGSRTLIVNVTDFSGVPNTSPGWPHLYWKIGVNGTYTGVAPTSVSGDNFTFNFGSGVVAGDTVFYYVVAQDNASTPQVGSVPALGASGFTTNPPAAGTPPTNAYSYLVAQTSLAGNYTVGLNAFNTISGKNIYFEKSVRTVVKEVWKPVPQPESKTEEWTEPILYGDTREGKGFMETVEVEEEVWTPMENGSVYEGNLFIKKSDNPNLNFPEGVEGVYATLTAAINDLNIRGISDNVTFLLVDTLYSTETLPIILNITNENLPSATKKITIKPNTGITSRISGTSATGVFVNFGVDYLTIDGSNSGGNDKSLVIENLSTAANHYVFGIFNNGLKGAKNSVLKNTIINGGSNTVASWGIILNFSGGDYDNTVIENNTINRVQTGMQFVGLANGITNNGVIRNNILGNDTDALSVGNIGINVSYVDGLEISGNTIYNLKVGTNPRGIILSTETINTNVFNNSISNLIYVGTVGYGGKGIDVNTSNLNSNISIYNNVITRLGGDGWNSFITDAIVGIRVLGVTGGIKIYFNSVNLFGNWNRSATATVSAAIFVQNTANSIDIRNNVLSNSIVNNTNTGARAYAIASDSYNPNIFSNINYNDYFASGTQGVLGLFNSIPRTTLTEWQTATGKDANSKAVNPQFTDTLNLRPLLGSQVLFAGTPITGITTDITGATRTNTPSMGAYEFPLVNIGWANLQWPPTDTIYVGGSTTVYAQIWIDGITNQPGPGVGIQAWIGVNSSNTNPSTWTTWIPAVYNVDVGNNDEYMAAIGSSLAPGTYYYASRFNVFGGNYVYGGYNSSGGGFWDGINNVSGVLVVKQPLIPLWQRAVSSSNLPSWFGADTERGLAYGKTLDATEAVNDRVFVVSRNTGTFVRILDANTGNDVGTLNTTGISGGTFALNDIAVTLDGKIIGCNLTTNASTSAFKFYIWNNESSAPDTLFSYLGDAVRLGDKFTVVGDYSAGTAEIWAASSTTGQHKVYKWTMSGGVFNPAPQVISCSDALTSGISSASVCPLPNGDFYWNANGQNARKYQANGTLIGIIPGTVVATGSNAIRYLGTVGNDEYIVTFAYGSGNNNARVLRIPNGDPTAAVLYGVTPTLGSAANVNGAGDVDFKYNNDLTVDIFVLATNNGVGAYRTDANIPVELTSFVASVIDRDVILNWSTATESNNNGFEVERKSDYSEKWSTITFIKSAGTTTEPQNYTYKDSRLESGKYSYRLKIVDLDGTYSYSSEVQVEVGIPNQYSLSQNYPNPFNPSTRIDYQLPFDAKVQLELYSITGEKVATLVSGDISAGYHTYELNASKLNLASGIYFYRINAVDVQNGKFIDTKKLVLLK